MGLPRVARDPEARSEHDGPGGGKRAPAGTVRVLRNGALESSHRFHVAVSNGLQLLASAGDPHRLTFYRSASKPFQALPLVEDGVLERFGLGPDALALACASHNSEREHVALTRRILETVGLDESRLECGGHPPLRGAEALRLADEGRRPGPVESNCSGKHAGMLALAVHRGWDPTGYVRPQHPVQRRMAREVARWSGVEPETLVTGTDGCGVPCFAVRLATMAAAVARFGRRAHAGEAPAVVLRAMADHAHLVAGRERLCTDLMRVEPGLMAKIGAEGVYVACAPARGLAVALKVEDGAMRAAEPALMAVLTTLGWLGPEAVENLGPYRSPVLRNTRGEEVGVLQAGVELAAE